MLKKNFWILVTLIFLGFNGVSIANTNIFELNVTNVDGEDVPLNNFKETQSVAPLPLLR